MKDFKFTDAELTFLRDIKKKGTITNKQALTVEQIYQRMEPGYTMCKTCSSIIATETNRLIGLTEKLTGNKIVFKIHDFLGASAKNIAEVVFQLTGSTVNKRVNKATLMKEALTLLNK